MKKIKFIMTLVVCMFALVGLSACNKVTELLPPGITDLIPGLNDNDDANDNTNDGNDSGDNTGNNDTNNDENNNGNTENNDDKIDLSSVTFEDATFEYTGEALGITVKNLPGTVKVNYTYTLKGKEVEEMVEIGVYDVKAVIISKETGAELKTLTAKLTIKAKEVFDEIEDDANANIKLTFGTTYVQLMKNPDDETQLIAAGLDLYASETIYFVLDDSETPLNFISLHEDSLECSSIVDNTLVINQPGVYDVIMMFPEGSMVPSILVREGAEASVLYFRSTINDYATTEAEAFTVNEETNIATYEVELAVGDVFLISNYYYSTKFDFNPHFMYLTNFTSGGEFGTDAKVLVAGNYKFEVNLETKALTVYCENEVLVEDRNMLYIRGTMNNWDSSMALSKRKDGSDTIAYVVIDLKVGDIFKIADAGWEVQYQYGYFTTGTENFKEGAENGNIEVLQAGSYEIMVNLNKNTVTVKFNGNEIISNATSSNTGGNGGGTATGSYALIITHADGTQTQFNLQPWENFGEHSQHFGDNVTLKEGDVISLYDVANDAHWVEKVLDPYGEHAKFTVTDQGIRCNQAGTYDFYVKFKWEDNMIYIGPAN